MSMGDGNHHPPGPVQTVPSGAPGAPPPPGEVPGKVSVSPRLRRRAAVPDAGSPEGMPLRRRWGRFAIGAFLALLGGWVSASLYISAGSRVEVVAMADDVEAYSPIDRDDLRIVRVAADPGVDTIDADDIDQIVDRTAAIDLVEGSLLTPNQLFREDADLLAENEVLVGADLESTDAPDDLCSGIDVRVVVSAAAGGEETTVTPIDGWLWDVGNRDEDTGRRHVTIAVPDSQANNVGSAAHNGELAVLALEPC
jgi:SAF domain-containing protein